MPGKKALSKTAAKLTGKSKEKTKKRPGGAQGKRRRQYAALPVRMDASGRPEVLLATSRGTQRWIIPKGWPMRRLSAGETAAREAFEEAGLEGRIADGPPIGHYCYDKLLDNGTILRIEVSIFLLHVDRQLDDWPEQAQRQTRWFTPARAAEMVAEPELAALLRDLMNRHQIPGLILDQVQ